MTTPSGQTAPPHRILLAGDGGLVVEFGTTVDDRLNRLVTGLDARVTGARLAGVIETVPTYRSLLVLFDPSVAERGTLAATLGGLTVGLLPDAEAPSRRWHVPVAYGGLYGEDLDAVAALHGLDAAEVVRLHSDVEYRVFMIGFAPGFAYLGGLPESLHTPRRTDPRPRTPAGSISIGGVQAAVASVPVPSGWHLLGRTPLRTFDPARADPFLLKPGDRVRFRPVAGAEYDRLAARAEKGEVVADVEDAA